MQEILIRELEGREGQILLFQEGNGPKLRIKIVNVKELGIVQGGLRVMYCYLDNPKQEIMVCFTNPDVINKSRHFYEILLQEEHDDPINIIE